jgi:hypothetical protein
MTEVTQELKKTGKNLNRYILALDSTVAFHMRVRCIMYHTKPVAEKVIGLTVCKQNDP